MLTHAHDLLAPDRAEFASDVGEYLHRRPRQLPSRFFYDALGSALFDAICRLPWYRITRAETALLAQHASNIVQGVKRPLSIAELGCGNGDKLAVLLEQSGEFFQRVHLIDISQTALDHAQHRLAPLACSNVSTFRGTYEEGLDGLTGLRSSGAWLVLFLGSNIGNFDPPAAHALLKRIRSSLRAGDALLLGADLVKPEQELILAYDDPLQVTAAFNRNLLQRINQELGGTFELEHFRHRAIWNAGERRVEMHLVSTRRHTVRIAAIDLDVTFEKDEAIWTESSYKWEPATVLQAGAAAGFKGNGQWIDREAGFALTRFVV